MALIAYVHVFDENGSAHVFGPGDSVPDWARAKITNPSVWSSVELAKVPVPPRAGPKGGRDKWVSYAESQGVTVDSGWKRDDIIDHLIESGIAVD